jgi:hypothetical protein
MKEIQINKECIICIARDHNSPAIADNVYCGRIIIYVYVRLCVEVVRPV